MRLIARSEDCLKSYCSGEHFQARRQSFGDIFSLSEAMRGFRSKKMLMYFLLLLFIESSWRKIKIKFD